ncbi:MAG: TonB-dependent receptor plug domain-containing protein [Sphingobacteriales bacterium]|nr:TonB-dependent receptor plug domain-containing protein [Sphingobacteriales bacterium]OJY83536.1 MAG: TonB-dependent receptor [Sphingobacteriales bacterium 44-15]
MKIYILICSAFFCSVSVSAQTAKGRVIDELSKPLEGAYIANLRSGTHAHVDETGFFIIANTAPGDSIIVSHIGYQSRILRYEDSSFNPVKLFLSPFELSEVVINSGIRHLNIISSIDLNTSPVNSSQELLRKVPGLFIGQHAGGGKAEQIFLRGFDCDHGTDINISVDGMPVNMVSHAHGQGYADLHFLIPETVDKIDFDKGPYFADKGNLATAGYVAFKTKERLESSSVSLEAGRFNTFRVLGLLDVLNTDHQSAYIASELYMTNGPFIAPQNFKRINLMGKYTAWLTNNDKLSFSLSHFAGKWNASGQIPQRAVDEGLITRFGSIDSTEGGHTSRTNVNLQYIHHVNPYTFIKNTAYYSHYNFELYSNFTFWLNDPVNGDQIRQKEGRNTTGFETELNKSLLIGNATVTMQAAAGFRSDAVHNIELSHTVDRKTTLQNIMLGDIDETNIYSYINTEFRTGKWLINPAIRFDHLQFNYEDRLAAGFSTQSQSTSIISPKLNFLYAQSKDLQYFIKLGKGFHSNDTRVVVAQSGRQILPAAYGADIGLIWKPLPRVVVNTALWYLYLQQEFVYVGDEGVVEPGGRTARKGIDIGLRWQLNNWLFFNGDLTYTHGRSLDDPKGENYIPLAPITTFTGGFSVKDKSGFSGSIKSRCIGDRPANEDNSIAAKGYFVTDMNINYQWHNIRFGIITENIFNARWNETQFATTSRLYNEPQAVTEIHFTPGTPFNIRAAVTFSF